MKHSITLIFAILLISAGCDIYEQNRYKEYYVVESYLVANSSLPKVRVSTTSPIEDEYDFKKNAISNADVQIRRLNVDSSVAEVYNYQQVQPGIYEFHNRTEIVRDQQLYQLHVTPPDGEVITSITYVPKSFETVNGLKDQYTYQSEQQIEIETTPSSYITGRQTYYIFTVNVVNPKVADLTPFYRDLVVNEDNDIGSYSVNSSGIVNEANYDRNTNGNINLKVPWLAVAFYDSNDVVANAIDDNMYNFLRSQDVQTGGTSISPGQIQNIRYNVKGGIGIFGSMASDTNRVFISRSEN